MFHTWPDLLTVRPRMTRRAKQGFATAIGHYVLCHGIVRFEPRSTPCTTRAKIPNPSVEIFTSSTSAGLVKASMIHLKLPRREFQPCLRPSQSSLRQFVCMGFGVCGAAQTCCWQRTCRHGSSSSLKRSSTHKLAKRGAN